MRKLSSVVCSLVLFLGVTLSVSGCNYQQDAQSTSNVLGTILSIAQADAGVVPAQDQAIYNNFVNLGITLHTQLNTCISAGTGKSAVLACFNTFAGGLTSTTELAQLRLLSGGTQSKVQLIVAAIITAVNIIMSSLGGNLATTPTVSATPASSQELHDFAIRAGLSDELDRYERSGR